MKHWLETMDGGRFDLLAPSPDISVKALAWGCARQPRYSGQWRADVRWYSVAEHSLHVAEAVRQDMGGTDRRMVRTALCHDLAEGILGDVPTPLKAMLPEYREIEDRVNRALAIRFDTIWPLPNVVKHFDARILVDETRALLSERDRADWGCLDNMEPVGAKIRCLPPRTVIGHFLRALADYGVTD